MEGFLAPRPFRPAMLGMIVLGHAALLGAVILAKGPQILVRDPIVTEIYTPVEPPPPPPIPPEPQPERAQQRSRIDTPTKIVDLTPIDSVTIDGPPLPPLPPQPPFTSGNSETVTRPAPPPAIVDATPDPRATFQPAYPPALQRAEVEGRATVRVLVGSDGRVHAVEIVAADDPAFAEATRRQALKSWRFRPATQGGVAVESWRTMTVHFRLQA